MATTSRHGKWIGQALVALALLVCFSRSLEAGALTLAWDANTESDIAGYIVYYGTTSGGYSSSVDVGNVTTWTGNTLTNGQKYYFAVRAYNTSQLQSPYSGEVSATIISTDDPGQITSPVPGSTLTGSSVLFQWSSGTGASMYRLQVGTTAGSGNLFDQTSLVGLSVTASGLPTNGSPVFVRLWTLIGTTWRFMDSTFTAAQAVSTRIISLSGSLAFGNLGVGSTATRTLTISNSGTGALTVTGISYPAGFTGNWSGSIAAGGSQAVTVTFAPTAATTYSGNVTVNANQTSGTTTISASGTGTPSRVIALSGSLVFSTTTVGSTSAKTLTIANSGSSSLTVSGITYPAGFTGNWSGGSIAAGSNRAVTVTFAPTAVTTYSGTVTVTADQTSGTPTASASGTGIAATRIITLSGSLGFDSVAVGSTSTRTLTISNTGTGALTVSSISYPTGFSGNWSGSIAAGGSQAVTVTFAPTAATSYSGTVTVNANQTSGTPTNGASGTGTTTVTKIISLTGSMAFSSVAVGQSATRTLSITNSGTSVLNVTSISYPTGFAGNWSGNISAGGTQAVTVTFTPTSVASYSGTVTVNSNKTSGTSTMSVSGTGTSTVTRIISLSGSLAFGTVAVGSTGTKTLLIANNGTATLAVSGISYTPGLTGNWASGNIAPGTTQAVTVTFTPVAEAPFSGTVTVTANQTSGTATMNASGIGGTSAARIGIPGDLDADRMVDLLWRTANGDVSVSPMSGLNVSQAVLATVPLSWQIAGVADLDGDGLSDIVWRESNTGDVAIWWTYLSNGSVREKLGPVVATGVPLAWQILGLRDLDGDGKADLVWRNTQTGDVAVWLMDGATIRKGPVVAAGLPLMWHLEGLGDLNGDGKADFVWRNTLTGDVAVWLMDGVTVKAAPIVASGVPVTWQIAGVGDLDGDSNADLVWRNTQTGDVAAWLMNGAEVKAIPVVASGVPLTWQVAKVADVNGDGKTDLVWRNLQTGDVAEWLMNGATITQMPVVAFGIPLTSQIQP